MRDVPGTEFIHFQKASGNYFISKKIKGVNYHFGTYESLEEAIKWRDYFRDNNWRLTERLHYSKSKYIVELPSGRYEVKKQEGGSSVSFGVFDSLADAEYQVKLCKSFGWDLRLKPFDCMKYIQRREMDKGTVYRIVRPVEGLQVYYGSFNSLVDAQFERDLLVLCDWDWDALASIDESFDGDCFLDGKYAGGNFVYRFPNGRIDYGVL